MNDKDKPMRPVFLLATLTLALAACSNPPDGSRGNPPGTEASRALDRAAGTNTSGAFPAQRDGTAVNPPGTAAERAVDRAAGTNTSGAFPRQSDGMPGNPRGTAASRALNTR